MYLSRDVIGVERILTIFKSRNYILTLEEAEDYWYKVSSSRSAGWLILESFNDKEVYDMIMQDGNPHIED